jgi:hypothetical protein
MGSVVYYIGFFFVNFAIFKRLYHKKCLKMWKTQRKIVPYTCTPIVDKNKNNLLFKQIGSHYIFFVLNFKILAVNKNGYYPKAKNFLLNVQCGTFQALANCW